MRFPAVAAASEAPCALTPASPHRQQPLDVTDQIGG